MSWRIALLADKNAIDDQLVVAVNGPWLLLEKIYDSAYS